MRPDMSAAEVITRIKELGEQGGPLSKRKVKEANPELFKNALYYYPSWEHAVRETGLHLD
ncbi:MAG: hypothetical protein K6T78_09900 [Alicyclobacillus sp.]|nr:hypothetical protein [Alicyclobacillus sp.]